MRCSSPTRPPTPNCSPPRPRTGRHARPSPRPGGAPARDAGGARQPRERAHQVLRAHQGADGDPEPGGDAGTHRDRRHAVVDLPRGRAVHEEPCSGRGPLDELLTSRQTWTSAAIATRIYGVAPPGQVDADGFGPIELRRSSGLLTLSTFLLSGARSTGSSPVARGLAVNGSVVCDVNPSFPRMDAETGQVTDPEVTAASPASPTRVSSKRPSTGRRAEVRRLSPAVRRLRHGARALRCRRALPRGGSRGPLDRRRWTTTALPDSVAARW